MLNKKSAFTLAEVLLVLAIIGVIAAVTIPSIMQQSSEKKYAALAKKASSTLQNAVNLKIATTPMGPKEMGVNIIVWLLDGEEDGMNTLKAAKTNADSTVIQTPDGAIWYHNRTFGTYYTTKDKPLNDYHYFLIDLNGSDPPTRTTVENAKTLLAGQQSNQKAYDLIEIFAGDDGRVRYYGGTTMGNRAQKYTGLQ